MGASGTGPGAGCALVFRIEGDCLEARASGTIGSMEAFIGFFADIAAELRRTGLRRVLILDRTRSIVPDEAQFQRLARAMAGLGFDAVRTAFVDVRGNSIGRIEIGEIIARAHGCTLRVFDDAQQAGLWLRYGPDDGPE